MVSYACRPRGVAIQKFCVLGIFWVLHWIRTNFHAGRGVHLPLRPWCISPSLFKISPYFRKIFRLCGKFSKFYLFPKNFSIFIRQNKNFWWPFFLVIDHKFIRIPPYFSCLSTFPPLFRKNYYLPLFWKIPPCFRKIHLLFTYFVYFVPPSTLTMMHLCITQCTYWTPLHAGHRWGF